MRAIAGIDFGSKLAGTTVIASLEEKEVHLLSSKKKEDADRMILDWAEKKRPAAIYLDAPLSLPGLYRGLQGFEDYFYRQADRAQGAMSPMFLGGLTARAMRLADRLRSSDIPCVEVYPAALVRLLDWPSDQYKKKGHGPEALILYLLDQFGWMMSHEPDPTWHMADALLALASGYRHQKGHHQAFGDPLEGQIFV